MKIRRILKPGAPGTKALLTKFGDRLVCVRYRYDEKQKRRYKTVEIILDEDDWNPPKKKSEIIGLKIDIDETDLQKQVKNVGGKWNRKQKVWEISIQKARALNLLDRRTS